MRQSRWNRPAAALAGAGLAVAMVAVPGSPATAAGQVAGPVLKLAAAQHSITLDSFGGQVYLDPGIWVEVLKSPLQFDVRRVSYARPFTITQNIHTRDHCDSSWLPVLLRLHTEAACRRGGRGR